MKKEYTMQELIELGKKAAEARSRGGESCLKKYGKEYFSEMGKKSAARRKELKAKQA